MNLRYKKKRRRHPIRSSSEIYEKQLEAKLVGKNIPIEAIDMLHYGMMNGEKVLEQALKIIESK